MTVALAVALAAAVALAWRSARAAADARRDARRLGVELAEAHAAADALEAHVAELRRWRRLLTAVCERTGIAVPDELRTTDGPGPWYDGGTTTAWTVRLGAATEAATTGAEAPAL